MSELNEYEIELEGCEERESLCTPIEKSYAHFEVGDLLYRRRQVCELLTEEYAHYGPITAVLSESGDYVWVEGFDNMEIGGFPLEDMDVPEIQESLDGFLHEVDRTVMLR